MLYVFLGNEHYKYQRQFEDCFSEVKFQDNLSVIHRPHASHILSEPDDRSAVVHAIADWVRSTSTELPAS